MSRYKLNSQKRREEEKKEQEKIRKAARFEQGRKNAGYIVKYGLTALCSLVVPILFFYLLECYTHNPFGDVRPWAQLFNIILFELAAGTLFCLTGRLSMALRIEGVFIMLFGIANAYVVRFRTNPIVPWDLFSIKTAASVADNYDFKPDQRMVLVTLAFLAVIAVLQLLNVKITRFAFWKRLLPAAALMILTGIFANTLQQESFQNRHRLYNKLFTPVYMTDVDGIAVTFVMNLAYMSIDKPAGYSADYAEEILKAYKSEKTQDTAAAGGGKLPNIIVVMNESFADLKVIGDFETNRDYMPYIHSLQQGAENTVTGMLNVSICGGNTANTEFEFLTGNTMAFLPQGSIPYQQYITGEIPSLAGYLKEMGYQTVAAHPYDSTGWERDTVYPWLGFSNSFFQADYRNAHYIRNYVSDKSCVDKIIELYENKEAGKPLFLFNVTMQNHGGYQDVFDNFTPEIGVEGVSNGSLDQYLSLIELSDASLEQLITYFKGVDEKTVVVFFGDHQPSDTVAYSILSMHGMAWNALDEEELKLRYQVPYVIWANYEIKEEQGADTSTNYLGAEVLSRAGVPTNAYQNYLLELKEQYPVFSTVRTVHADGSEASVSNDDETLMTYRRLQYYQLFDWEGE